MANFVIDHQQPERLAARGAEFFFVNLAEQLGLVELLPLAPDRGRVPPMAATAA